MSDIPVSAQIEPKPRRGEHSMWKKQRAAIKAFMDKPAVKLAAPYIAAGLFLIGCLLASIW